MPRLEACAAAGLMACAMAAGAAADDAASHRYQAAIVVERPAAFVQLPLPASAYARSQRVGLQDLRIVDARGARVPFAVLPPRSPEAQSVEQQHDAVLYPLPPKPASGDWIAPVDVKVQGDRITVTRRGRPADGARAVARPGGWLIDLGERERDAPPPQSLRLQWSGPAEFSAVFVFDTSDDLRAWRRGGSGQVMALTAGSGTLTQPVVLLPSGAGRFVRLAWLDAGTAPALSGAKVLASQQRSRVLDAPSELVFTASAPPNSKIAPDAAAARALHFDLGGMLPLTQLDLRLAPGTRVVPAQVQGRDHADDPWRDLGAAVFYRLERDGQASHSPPLALHITSRYLRVVPDVRVGPLEATQTQLVVQAQLASLVFVAQGEPPFALQAGSREAAPSALPIHTLVPALDNERSGFGRATLEPWNEVAAAVKAEQTQQRIAMLRPWLLWTVLVVGVAMLGFMVWRLARAKPTVG